MSKKNEEYILSIDGDHQLYLLEWMMAEDREVTIGKLGSFLFPKGIYLYVGSARKNIQARVTRHLAKEKKKRWHMDYLRSYIEPVKAVTFPLHRGECSLKDFVEKNFQGHTPIKGFGSSDCKCSSHLIMLPTTMTATPDQLRERWEKWA